MAAAIFVRVVSRYGKVTMRYWMKPLTAPPGGKVVLTSSSEGNLFLLHLWGKEISLGLIIRDDNRSLVVPSIWEMALLLPFEALFKILSLLGSLESGIAMQEKDTITQLLIACSL
ncbi:hypothetical protein AVEN_171583-1 [Araneus ventricosus]|uniref:Uncharacterized protein n=1 Tax=Araneus ventricosus TaxID=182803 RepID=A0A4Y2K8B5_ARAVE|nr:hypothetical protein AVEN_171583-1 [Araneus ventricosus]